MKKQAKNSTMKTLEWVMLLALVLALFILFGCGGDDDDDGATNTAPTAADGTLTVGINTTVTGRLIASDADGDTLTYSIVGNGTLGTATITDTATGAYTYTPNQDEGGSDRFSFKVNDGAEDSNEATVTVTINPVNDLPVANAGDEQTVDEQTVVFLSGTGTDTEDGDNVTYAWTQIEGPAVILTGADTATPSFIGPAVAASTTLTFSLTVIDTEGAESTADEVMVTVNNAGNLSGSVQAAPDTVNLTAEGGLDWSHWGHTVTNMFNQNATGLDLVGDYEVIGDKTAVRFENNPTAFSWTGGTPNATAINSTTGIYFLTTTQGDGIRLTVPANSTEKTFKIYLGVTSIRAKLTATLSDDSAVPVEVFVENSLWIAKSSVVTLNFGAAADGETLTIDYTLVEDIGSDAGGAINLSAATLTEATAAMPTITPDSGMYTNSVTVELETATPGATIRYTVDGTDPDGSSNDYTDPFNLSASATVKARAFLPGFNDSTIATADFIVNASNEGSLSACVQTAPDTIDLTAEGGMDWSHWGLVDENSFNRKEAGLNRIGDYSDIGEITAARFANNPTAFSWTGGTPTSKVTDSTTGLYFGTGAANPLEEGDGIRLTVPADSAEKTLKIYLGVTSARAKLTATLSDGSAVPVEVFVENPIAMAKSRVVTLNFGAAADGETITIDYTFVEDIGADAGGAINLSAATLN